MDRARIERQRRQRGGVLVAAAGILVIVTLSVFALALLRTSERSLAKTTSQRLLLDRADSALAQFVARHQRLPCPARGSLASAGAGTESINLASGQCVPANQADGVLPWVTLGLSESDALDGWGGRISYRVQPSLASNLLSLMNMGWCRATGSPTPPGPTGVTQACTPAPCSGSACMFDNDYLYGKGLQVKDGAGAWLRQPSPPWAGAPAPTPRASGAAYVLVTHGSNGAGAYNAGGTLQPGSSAAGTSEQANSNATALSASTVFIDQDPVATAGTAYFDDLLSHPTLAEVLGRAALGPRAH